MLKPTAIAASVLIAACASVSTPAGPSPTIAPTFTGSSDYRVRARAPEADSWSGEIARHLPAPLCDGH